MIEAWCDVTYLFILHCVSKGTQEELFDTHELSSKSKELFGSGCEDFESDCCKGNWMLGLCVGTVSE